MTIKTLLDTIESLINEDCGITFDTKIKVHLTPSSKGYTPEAIGYADNTNTLGLILHANRPCGFDENDDLDN